MPDASMSGLFSEIPATLEDKSIIDTIQMG
jgi:hypothetical protein